MNVNYSTFDYDPELLDLLEQFCEERLSEAGAARLEELVLSDVKARQLFVSYVELHGTLHWDAAVAEAPVPAAHAVSSADSTGNERPSSIASADNSSSLATSRFSTLASARSRGVRIVMLSACCLLIALGSYAFFVSNQTGSGANSVVNVDPEASVDPAATSNPERVTPPVPPTGPLELPGPLFTENRNQPVPPERPTGTSPLVPIPSGEPIEIASSGNVTEFINQQVRRGWDDAEVTPSPRASDAEWVRRVYLDLAGRIPTADEVSQFLASKAPNRDAELVDHLLASPQFAGNMSTVWSNLLIGRSRDVAEREPLEDYLRTAFANNQPWSETVQELVAAEGSPETNGASSFLLAHLNNEAVPATAITARVFMGLQVQCTQCHDHPSNDWKQNQFWELNSFFKQTKIVESKENGKTVRELVSTGSAGPTLYEDRRGVMKAAYPRFGKTEIEDDGVNLRERLAEMMVQGDETRVAMSMVNRTWAHLFGRGFTLPIDDMGPHNQPTHPDLLKGLAREFVKSRYDVKQLTRWIVLSEPYRLTSQVTADNSIDDPEVGELPVFSRVYVKPMTAEQVYESLVTAATEGKSSSESRWKQRQNWLQQFVHPYETEENNELTQFNGTIPQALELMNGDLVDQVTSAKPGSLLHSILSKRGSLDQKVEQVALATVSRKPTKAELTAARKIARQRVQMNATVQLANARTLQDLLWAYLNSSEFILVH